MGSSSKRVAANLRHIRREHDVTTAALSQRLASIGHPIADTGITKTEKEDRRVDADDLVALALALGVTPNTLLLPPVGYLGASDPPAHPGSQRQRRGAWQWAQGERPLDLPIPGAEAWLGGPEHRDLMFAVRNRPYLAAVHAPGSDDATPPPNSANCPSPSSGP